MTVARKNIDQITRTLTALVGTERLAGRDGSGDFKITTRNFLKDLSSVKTYGAVGDGSTDDTAAFVAAMAASDSIYIPAGNYVLTTLTPSDNQSFFGDGISSVLTYKSGEAGTLFDCYTTPVNVQFRNLNLFGGLTSTQSAASQGDRSGIIIASQKITKINKCIVHGFSEYGIANIDATRDRLTHLSVDDCESYFNHFGLYLGADNAEYTRMNNLDIHGCRFAIYLASGNVIFSNCKTNDCYYGIYLLGTAIANNGHGSMVGCQLNHHEFPISAIGITIGFIFSGCNIFDGTISIVGCTGITVSNSIIDVDEYILNAGGRNEFINNYCHDTYANTVTHVSSDDTVFINNFTGTGAMIDETVSFSITGELKKTKIINIGNWDMNTSVAGVATVNVAHGVALNTIMSISVLINTDDAAERYPISYLYIGVTAGSYRLDATNIILESLTGGFFDAASFDADPYNRGVILMEYLA